ncbi:SDR family NAD(P)-dependent oxidoreductase, partial [Streptomyces sp. NPDC059762]
MTTALDYTTMFRLDGRRAVVLGAGSGIGREAAQALAAQGAEVICADLDPDAAAATADRAGPAASALALDVLDRA